MSFVAVALAVAAGVGAPAAGAAADRTKTVRHSGHYWVWFGPRSWSASYGAYGITITSPSGNDVLDLGFSSIGCAGGNGWDQSVKNYFAGKRAAARRQGFAIEKKSKIVHPGGTSGTYRRQRLQMSVRNGGVTFRGLFTFDYDYSTTVDGLNYCYQRSLAEYAPTGRWNRMRTTLHRIETTLAYSGPGVPGEEPDQNESD